MWTSGGCELAGDGTHVHLNGAQANWEVHIEGVIECTWCNWRCNWRRTWSLFKVFFPIVRINGEQSIRAPRELAGS
jgi:hypothetical protein